MTEPQKDAQRSERHLKRTFSRMVYCGACGGSDEEKRALVKFDSGWFLCNDCIEICSDVVGKYRQVGTVYAFEWLDCIYESAYRVVSLHQSKRDSFKAMVAHANKEWQMDRNMALMYGKCGFVEPLKFTRWRVKPMAVNPANA